MLQQFRKHHKSLHRLIHTCTVCHSKEESMIVEPDDDDVVSNFDTHLQKDSKWFSNHPIYELGKVDVSNYTLESIPKSIKKPKYKKDNYSTRIELKDKQSLLLMKNTCQLARKVLDYALSLAKVGVTTHEIDQLVFEYILHNNAYPSPFLYESFPKSICTSVNEVLVHGIPDDRKLQHGDVINIDVTVYKNGFHGDCNGTVIVKEEQGVVENEKEIQQLIDATKLALHNAIEHACKPNHPFYLIGQTIEETIHKVNPQFKVAKNLCGHGIGTKFHGLPQIFHGYNTFGEDIVGLQKMIPGLTFTVEPVILTGTTKYVQCKDGWTLMTADRFVNAQFEHTVAITKKGVEILTM